MLEVKPTERGFLRGDFTDANGDACSIQESSIDPLDKIWLGMNQGTHHLGECCARMHLTREHVRSLLPWLTLFVETGMLRRDDA